MGHAGLSSLLVLLVTLLLTSLHATTAARVPAQNTAEAEPNEEHPILDQIRHTVSDPRSSSIEKAKFRESLSIVPSKDMSDRDLSDIIFDDAETTTADSTTVTTTDSSPTSTEDSTSTSETSISTSETSISTSETSISTSETPISTSKTSISTSKTPISTSETPISTSKTSISTSKTSISTSKTSISTSETSISTSETFTSTSETSTSPNTETPTASSSSVTPPLEDLERYTETQNELNQITTILDNFLALVGTQSESVHVDSMASARRVWGGRDLPVTWWQRRKSSLPREDIDICVNEPSVDITICTALETNLQDTDALVAQLTEDVDAWQDSDLKDLTEQREELEATYALAAEDGSGFVDSVNDQFTGVVGSVKEKVASGSSAVQGKIDDLNAETKNSGSIALVATLGSVGGLMVVSLIGVIIYGAVQKSKAKKKLSSPKAKKEDIPIDAYARDGPGSRPPPKMDPYSAAPVPAPRNYQHPGQFDPRREPVFPEPINGRPQQGLRRTNY